MSKIVYLLSEFGDRYQDRVPLSLVKDVDGAINYIKNNISIANFNVENISIETTGHFYTISYKEKNAKFCELYVIMEPYNLPEGF